MKASPLEQKELLRLQAADIKIVQLTHQTTTFPEIALLKTLGSSLDGKKMTLAARAGERDDVRTELRRTESDVDVVEKRIQRNTERAQTTSSAKDVQAYEVELAALRKRLLDLEEIEIAVMERLEEHDAAVAVVENERDDILAQIQQTANTRDSQLVDVNRQLGELVRDRETVAASIAPDLAALYEKRRVTGHGNAAALLRARTCSGCTMTLTGSDLAEVRLAPVDEVVFCPDCGAILVRTEESGI